VAQDLINTLFRRIAHGAGLSQAAQVAQVVFNFYTDHYPHHRFLYMRVITL
jgi:hypothetical protein